MKTSDLLSYCAYSVIVTLIAVKFLSVATSQKCPSKIVHLEMYGIWIGESVLCSYDRDFGAS